MQQANAAVIPAGRPAVRVVAGRRPLVPAAVCLMLGILAGAYLPLPAGVGLLALLAALMLSAVLFALRVSIALPLLAACFLAGYTLLAASLPGWAADPGAPAGVVDVRGRIVEIGAGGGAARQYTLDDLAVNGKPMEGRALVTVKGPGAGAREGDGLSAAMELMRPEPSRYSGGFNARGYYLRRGIRYTAFVESAAITPSGRADTVWDLPRRAREYASGVLNRYLSPEGAALVSALLSGDKSGISDDVSESFVDLGVAHLLAVSGLNISLTAGAAWLLCRKLRVPMPVSYLVSFLVMASYVMFAGLTPSVERAAVMWVAMMGGLAAARRYDPLSSISAAAIAILALNPLDLFDAGFQLSFAATAAMFLWLAPLMRHAPEKRWMKALASSVGVTVVVTILALPVIVGCFNSVSLISPLANLVLVPASFVLQLGGTALLLTGFLPGVAELLGGLLNCAAGFYLQNVRMLDWAGTAVAAATPPVWMSAAFAVFAAAVSPSLVRMGRRPRAVALTLLAAALCLMLLPMPPAFAGHGDAAVISEGGRYLSVYWQADGKRYAASDGGVRELAGYLKSRGIDHLDGLYIHRAKPPKDGNLLLALDGVDADRLYVPGAWLADPAAAPLLEQGLILGMEPVDAGARGEAADVLLLAMPGELAGALRSAYNISDCGSVEIRLAGGTPAAVPWRDGWEDGLQGNFR